MRLAIADPPYPPSSSRTRASRHYGHLHPSAAEWDDPARHRELIERLDAEYDGWAIATCSDGLGAYWPLPASSRIMAWVKPRPMPSNHRLTQAWEPVIVSPPVGRRSSRGPLGALRDAHVSAAHQPRLFVGSKPASWTRWVLDALSYDPAVDTVADLFPGSGAVTAEIDQEVFRW